MRRLLLILLAGLLLLGAVGAFLWSLPPIPADAQGVGFFGTSATGTRTNCNQITNPVVGQSACLDQSTNTWRVYTGASTSTTNWVSVANSATQTGTNNVRDFGAVGDGATDDTTAIRAAVAAVVGGGSNPNRRVFFPPGYYKVTGTIEVPPNTWLIGTGRLSTDTVGTPSNPPAATVACAFDGVCIRFVRRNAVAGSLWHMGGAEKLGFTGANNFSITTTTASRIIELGDANAVTTSTGAWTVILRELTITNVQGGYGIYSAHSQDVTIQNVWLRVIKFPVYFNTVISTAKIIGNYFLDETAIAGAIAMQFRPGSLGGSAGGPLIQGNYVLGYKYGVWNTSIIGMSIRDNVFEATYETPIYQTAYLSDQVTQDGNGPVGTLVDGNTFINWGASAAGSQPAIQLSYSLNGFVGLNSYQSPNGGVATGSMLNLFDNSCSPQCTKNNVIVAPVCSGNNCAGLAEVGNTVVALQNTFLGRDYLQQQVRTADPSGLGAGFAGRFWWDNATKRGRQWDGTSAFTVASFTVLNINDGIQIGPTTGDPGAGALRVASAVYLNATQTLWNGGTTTGTPRCTNNCGSGTTLAGTNTALRITAGTSVVSPFLVLFNGTWNATPGCTGQLNTPLTTAASHVIVNMSATGVLVNTRDGGGTPVNPPNAAVYSIHCLGVG